ncbi:MAG: cysteine desulfurase [Alphaproteobacteria bacterium]|nr:MAG: cysteine desulfurase [Alphaproteobacteria bacterium]
MSRERTIQPEAAFEGEVISLPLYLDYPASTPLDPRVFDAMSPLMQGARGNPHSRTHALGFKAHHAIEEARIEIARLIQAKPHEIIFTSSATEANNLALLGILRAATGRRHVISCVTEHEAILRPLEALAEEGVEITLLPVDTEGRIDIDELEGAIRPETTLITLMAANNETGVIHDLNAIGRIAAHHGIPFHSDAAQGLGTLDIDVGRDSLAALSLSSHKIYGPSGIGALYLREDIEIRPIFHGGAQEKTLRPGTLPTALCVGFGEACRLLLETREEEAAGFTALRQEFLATLRAKLGNRLRVNGEEAAHIPNCLSLTIDGVEAEDLIDRLPDLALSTGSACTSARGEPSHVLIAMGRTAVEAAATLRLGFGRSTRTVELRYAAHRIAEAVQSLIS